MKFKLLGKESSDHLLLKIWEHFLTGPYRPQWDSAAAGVNEQKATTTGKLGPGPRDNNNNREETIGIIRGKTRLRSYS